MFEKVFTLFKMILSATDSGLQPFAMYEEDVQYLRKLSRFEWRNIYVDCDV